MGGGLLNLVSYGNFNIIVNGNPQRSLFVATYKRYTNFGLQKHITNCNITTPKLKENESSTFNFTIARLGDLIADTFFTLQMPYIWSPVFVEPTDIYDNPRTPYSLNIEEGLYVIANSEANEANEANETSNIRRLTDPHIPHVQPFEFKWIEDLGSQLIKKISVSIGDTIIQEFSGDYLTNMVKRDFTNEKKKLFNEMTGNVVEMHSPELFETRNGFYPNCLYAAPLPNNVDSKLLYKIYNNKQAVINKEITDVTNLCPSINKKTLIIPLNLWYMLSSAHAFPLLSLSDNLVKIKIECRPIRELFRIRDVRYYIDTYYHHNIAIGKTAQHGSGKSIYEHYKDDYYKGNNVNNTGFSQFDIFKPYVPPPFISTINTTDPLYQMYMFTTQYASQNQQFIQQAALKTNVSADIASLLRESSIWNCNPRLVSTFVYLDTPEQEVFKEKPQHYLVKQILEHFFETENHKDFSQIRFKSNSVAVNFMWYLQRNDVFLRNEWTNYTNWPSNEKPYTLQPFYYKKLDNSWYLNKSAPIYAELTSTTTNPAPKFSQFPELFEVSTSMTKPLTAKQMLYLQGTNAPYIPYVIEGLTNNPSIYSNKLISGTSFINKSMKKYPPYFPFSFKSPASQDPLESSGCNPYITGPNRKQTKTILQTWALKLDGKNKENTLNADYYNYVEPFLRSSGTAVSGLYTYSFSLNTNPFIIDPVGYANLINYNHIDFEYKVIELEKINDINKVAILPLCIDNEFFGFNKSTWLVYEYNFTLKLFEEQYNFLTIKNGLASLKFQHSN
jgi:hypothetical protein